MKQIVIRQFGFGENCYVREFIAEVPDDLDESAIDEDTVGRLADASGADWTYHDAYDPIVPTDHEVLACPLGESDEGLPTVRYETESMESETEHDHHQTQGQLQ